MTPALGELVADAAHPVGQPENLVNDHDHRRLLLALGINHERLDGAVARFELDPFAVPRRFLQARFRPILGRQR